MKITYAITVCDEIVELKSLLNTLFEEEIDVKHEIVILHDVSKSNEEMEEYLDFLSQNSFVKVFERPLQNDFAKFKNNLLEISSGEYIFQIDADEIPSENILKYLEYILEENSDIDCFKVPRRNIVKGITQEHLKKWGWRMDENGYINPFDPQFRLFKNNKQIFWKNPVHEVLVGYKRLSMLPNDFFLWHIKTIEKQELQNNFYEKI